jgi:stage II sporulation protein D
VRETDDRVLLFAGEPARTYYSSTCGGHTSTLTDVWEREGAPYLVGRRDADPRGRSWCRDSPHFRWTESWSARELGEEFRRDLGTELGRPLSAEEFGVLQGLRVVSRDRSGRVRELRVFTDRDSFTVVGDRIRWALRPAHSRFAILRSTLFEIEEVRRDGTLVQVIVRGGGFGHGVGLCQTGALGQARAGRSAAEILESYYPGAIVKPRRRIVGLAR